MCLLATNSVKINMLRVYADLVEKRPTSVRSSNMSLLNLLLDMDGNTHMQTKQNGVNSTQICTCLQRSVEAEVKFEKKKKEM